MVLNHEQIEHTLIFLLIRPNTPDKEPLVHVQSRILYDTLCKILGAIKEKNNQTSIFCRP